MKVLVIGATGKVGSGIINSCRDMGFECRAFVRDSKYVKQFQSIGVETVIGNLHDDMSSAFDGCDHVVFSAGSGAKSGAEATLLVDLWGSILAIEQAEKSGVSHFIMISSLKADDPLNGPDKIQHYLVARNIADARLLNSNISNKIVLRPGRLLDEPGTGMLSREFDWDDKTNKHTTVTREDVVGLVINILAKPILTGSIVEFINGQVNINNFVDKYRNIEE